MKLLLTSSLHFTRAEENEKEEEKLNYADG